MGLGKQVRQRWFVHCYLINFPRILLHLKPWYRNITKRLVKSHKLYFHDVMLLCNILGATPGELAKNQPGRFSRILENFVLEHQQKLVAIEVKYTENISEKDLLGLRELQQVTNKDFHAGIVLCNTPRVIAYDDNIFLIPFAALWQ